jgi:16S rRNA (guanine1207-N2)-methyltransferase
MNRNPVNSADRPKKVEVGGQSIDLVCLPGLPDNNIIAPSIRLLADHVELQPADHILLYNIYQGSLPVYLASRLSGGKLSIVEHDYTALNASQLGFKANNIPVEAVNIISAIDLPMLDLHAYDTVIIQIPKGRMLARRWLVQANQALKLGGKLYLAGANSAGIQSVIKDAQQIFGLGTILGYQKSNRVARFVIHPGPAVMPDWMDAPGIAPHTWVEFTIQSRGKHYPIHSLPGVFSFDHLDGGTKMLLETVDITPGSTVLDMGCGYGIIGLYAAANAAHLVHLADNNLLAVTAAQETMRLNHHSNFEVFPLDILNQVIPQRYDLILSNLPFHTAHAVDYQAAQAMISRSFQALNPGGRLVIVANRFIRYQQLIQQIFGNASVLAESSQYHVLSGLKSL